MAVADQAVAVAASGQSAEDIEAIGKHADPPWRESLPAHPVEDELSDLSLLAGGTLDVAQAQGEFHELVPIDADLGHSISLRARPR